MITNISILKSLSYFEFYLEKKTEFHLARVRLGISEEEFFSPFNNSGRLESEFMAMSSAENAASNICEVTGLKFWVLFAIAKYVRRLKDRNLVITLLISDNTEVER